VLLRPGDEEEEVVPPLEPPAHGAEEGVAPPVPIPPPPQPAAAVYRRVTIDTPVDWRQWYDFYQTVIQPLVESGAEVKVEVSMTATGEIDANLVDLSVKESVVQMDRRGRVQTKG
jgi:hypothetical protein